MSPGKKPQPDRDKHSGGKNSDMRTRCPKCGESLKCNPPAVEEDPWEDDDFICPACCCGIYIEVKDN